MKKVFLIKSFAETDKETSFQWMDLAKGDVKIIWKGENAGRFAFDKSESVFVFNVTTGQNNAVWYYKTGMR